MQNQFCWAKVKVLAEQVPSRGCRGELVSLHFQLLVAAMFLGWWPLLPSSKLITPVSASVIMSLSPFLLSNLPLSPSFQDTCHYS